MRHKPRKKLTITLDARVYAGLHTVIGRRRISRFIELLVRPHVLVKTLDTAYREMARDEAREAEALVWAEATADDVAEDAPLELTASTNRRARRRGRSRCRRKTRKHIGFLCRPVPGAAPEGRFRTL